jgi:uncharacterized membrane protein
MDEETSELVLFFGRFHPLILHLPIGFLVIAFTLEIMSRFPRFRSYKAAVGFVLASGAVLSVIAAVLGLMLAQAGDYSPDLLPVHKWSGIAVAVLACASFILHRISLSKPVIDKFYLSALSLTMLLLAIAGHYGGSLTHGSDYLTRYMPNTLRKLSGLPAKTKKVETRITNIDEARVFDDIIYPIMDARCVSCHNEDKRKGDLMMHTQEALMKGGENGPIFIPGDASASGMIERIHLPQNHDDHMPPDGKSQLTDEQVDLLTWWVEQGAPFDKRVAEVKVDEKTRQILDALVDPDANKTEVEKLLASPVPPADEKELRELKDKGVLVRPLANEVHWLQANVVSQKRQPADSLMHSFLKVSSQLTWLNLGGTEITDDALSSIGALKNLTRLHLENTDVTDKGLQHLKQLPYLEYLNLYGTRVTDSGIQELASLKNLKKLYLWQTNVTPEGEASLKDALPGLEVIRGVKENRNDALKEQDQSHKAQAGSTVQNKRVGLVKN